MTLFDPEEAARLKKDGMARSEDHAAPDWSAEVDQAVLRAAKRSLLFTTDDVWGELILTEATTHDPRAMGPAMRRACAAGWCSPTDDYRQSTRPACHQRPLRVWFSLVTRGGL